MSNRSGVMLFGYDEEHSISSDEELFEHGDDDLQGDQDIEQEEVAKEAKDQRDPDIGMHIIFTIFCNLVVYVLYSS